MTPSTAPIDISHEMAVTPAIVIRIAIEQDPIVYVDAKNESEYDRLAHWVVSAGIAPWLLEIIELSGRPAFKRPPT